MHVERDCDSLRLPAQIISREGLTKRIHLFKEGHLNTILIITKTDWVWDTEKR